MNPAEIDELVADYLAGASLPVLVERFGVHRTTAAGHLEQRGIQRRGTTRALSNEQVRQAAALYSQGTSFARLGDHYVLHPETIRRSLARHGIRARPRRGGPS